MGMYVACGVHGFRATRKGCGDVETVVIMTMLAICTALYKTPHVEGLRKPIYKGYTVDLLFSFLRVYILVSRVSGLVCNSTSLNEPDPSP